MRVASDEANLSHSSPFLLLHTSPPFIYLLSPNPLPGFTHILSSSPPIPKLYKSRTLYEQIVCFPCNQFGGQEPGSNAEIKAFAADKFGFEGAGVNMMDKIDVNGGNTSPVWEFLKEKFPGDVSWK